MNANARIWTIGVIIAISLFSTVVALSVQRVFGMSWLLSLIGPAIAIGTVLLVIRHQRGLTK